MVLVVWPLIQVFFSSIITTDGLGLMYLVLDLILNLKSSFKIETMQIFLKLEDGVVNFYFSMRQSLAMVSVFHELEKINWMS